jgi:hypothetical protein
MSEKYSGFNLYKIISINEGVYNLSNGFFPKNRSVITNIKKNIISEEETIIKNNIISKKETVVKNNIISKKETVVKNDIISKEEIIVKKTIKNKYCAWCLSKYEELYESLKNTSFLKTVKEQMKKYHFDNHLIDQCPREVAFESYEVYLEFDNLANLLMNYDNMGHEDVKKNDVKKSDDKSDDKSYDKSDDKSEENIIIDKVKLTIFEVLLYFCTKVKNYISNITKNAEKYIYDIILYTNKSKKKLDNLNLFQKNLENKIIRLMTLIEQINTYIFNYLQEILKKIFGGIREELEKNNLEKLSKISKEFISILKKKVDHLKIETAYQKAKDDQKMEKDLKSLSLINPKVLKDDNKDNKEFVRIIEPCKHGEEEKCKANYMENVKKNNLKHSSRKCPYYHNCRMCSHGKECLYKCVGSDCNGYFRNCLYEINKNGDKPTLLKPGQTSKMVTTCCPDIHPSDFFIFGTERVLATPDTLKLAITNANKREPGRYIKLCVHGTSEKCMSIDKEKNKFKKMDRDFRFCTNQHSDTYKMCNREEMQNRCECRCVSKCNIRSRKCLYEIGNGRPTLLKPGQKSERMTKCCPCIHKNDFIYFDNKLVPATSENIKSAFEFKAKNPVERKNSDDKNSSNISINLSSKYKLLTDGTTFLNAKIANTEYITPYLTQDITPNLTQEITKDLTEDLKNLTLKLTINLSEEEEEEEEDNIKNNILLFLDFKVDTNLWHAAHYFEKSEIHPDDISISCKKKKAIFDARLKFNLNHNNILI